eukprot:4922045-Pleurochrysis_carterae.AAC.1
MACKLYVGNLSYETSWQRLKDHFRPAGEVVHADIMQDYHGRSKGCGLVTMATPEEATRAMTELNETELDGRPIFVREDRDNSKVSVGLPAPGSRRVEGVVRPGTRAVVPPSTLAGSAKLYVGNLAYETTWQVLKDHFRQAGDVVHADILQGRDGRSKGCGLVTMGSCKEANIAIETLNDTELNGRRMFVREDREEAAVSGLPAPGARNDATVGYRGGGGGGTATGESVFATPAAASSAAPVAVSKVYVGNLSYETSWQSLKDLFSQVGDVVHADILQTPQGRSKGCGIVTMRSAADAAFAIEQLHETELDGRNILVREDREAGNAAHAANVGPAASSVGGAVNGLPAP